MQRPVASGQRCWLGRAAHVCPCPVAQPSNPFLCRKPLLKRFYPSNRRSAEGFVAYSAGVTPPEVLANRSMLVHNSLICYLCASCCRTVAEAAFHRQETLHPHQIGRSMTAKLYSCVQDIPACPCQLIAYLHRCNDQNGSTAQQQMVSPHHHQPHP